MLVKSIVLLVAPIFHLIRAYEDIAFKSGRLLSNPFGILGHESCGTKLEDGRNATGICYNEVECLLKGGLFAGYCGPPKVEGVCCVFSSSRCDKRITDRIAYFTNPGFPRNDVEPFQCMLSIKPAQDVCWIRFDLETFELAADGAGGQCTFDSMVILNSPSGPGGQLCGHKSGYSIMAKSPVDKDLKLSVLTQGPSYRWNIKISQLKCNELASLPSNSNCGGSNPNGTGGTFQRSLSKKILRRKRIRRMKRSKSNKISRVAQKKLRNEKFFPSFTARNTFCTPKIRQGNQNNILTKIIDGTETGINEYPWMVSLQLSGDHFCGGSIISTEWILTAAHCLEFGNVPDFLQRLTVSIGDHDLSVTSETKSYLRHAKRIIFPSGWQNLAGASGDIALIQLNEPINFSVGVRPICLPDQMNQKSYARENGTAIGWGITESGSPSDYLRHVQLNIIDNITCFETFKSLDVDIREDFICTFSGPLGTENICSGDSGSPLMVNQAGKFIHVGLVSFSLADCTEPFPAVFTRSTYYLDWIMAAITNVP